MIRALSASLFTLFKIFVVQFLNEIGQQLLLKLVDKFLRRTGCKDLKIRLIAFERAHVVLHELQVPS